MASAYIYTKGMYVYTETQVYPCTYKKSHRYTQAQYGVGWGERGRQDREWRIIKNEFNFCGLVCLKVF